MAPRPLVDVLHGAPLRRAVVATALALACGAAACGPEPAIDRGRALFSDPGFARESTNVFSCATCHATTPGGDPARTLPGYTLADSVHRASWVGGAYVTLLDAVSWCYVEFMRGRPLARDDIDGRALLVYLESISPAASSPALPLTVEKDLPALPPGDAARGAATWARACAYCHGDAHTGRGRLGPRVTIVPEGTVKEHGTDPATGARPITIEKVRHGKFFMVGGNMPLYSTETLRDADIADVLTYLGL